MCQCSGQSAQDLAQDGATQACASVQIRAHRMAQDVPVSQIRAHRTWHKMGPLRPMPVSQIRVHRTQHKMGPLRPVPVFRSERTGQHKMCQWLRSEHTGLSTRWGHSGPCQCSDWSTQDGTRCASAQIGVHRTAQDVPVLRSEHTGQHKMCQC